MLTHFDDCAFRCLSQSLLDDFVVCKELYVGYTLEKPYDVATLRRNLDIYGTCRGIFR